MKKESERVARSKETVLATTYQMLTEFGLGGVTIDAVSKKSGVAKTTIYRHWPSRTALLLNACSKLGAKREMPDTGSLRGDLKGLTSFVAEQLNNAQWPHVLPSIMDAAERDPEIAMVHSKLHAGMIAPFRLAVERAQERGELSKDLDPSHIVAAIVGPFFYRRWFSREKIDAKFVKGVMDRAMAMAGNDPA